MQWITMHLARLTYLNLAQIDSQERLELAYRALICRLPCLRQMAKRRKRKH